MAKLYIAQNGLISTSTSDMFEVDETAFAPAIARVSKMPRRIKRQIHHGMTLHMAEAQVRKQSHIKRWWEHRLHWTKYILNGFLGKVHPTLKDDQGHRLVEFVDGRKLWV
jgi:hypothetical protein